MSEDGSVVEQEDGETDMMEILPCLYLEEEDVFSCISCGRMVAVPEDHPEPTTCPWGCEDD